MPEEFGGDLAGAVFWGADLSGARFRDVNLTDAKISHAWLVNVNIDALVDAVVINGVDVTAYVNERDPWYPLRAMLRPASPEAMRSTWAALEDEWAKTTTRAQALPEARLHESVNGEWSFVQTLQHLVFAMDKWFTAPILGVGFHPMGLPNTFSVDFPWPGLDDNLTPSVSEALAVRADRARRFRDYLVSVATTDFTRPIEVLENGTSPLVECMFTVFEEEFWHNRYAQRDLAQLEAR
jgi:DinB superfamily/Pentapeptide repeats (8 copies)